MKLLQKIQDYKMVKKLAGLSYDFDNGQDMFDIYKAFGFVQQYCYTSVGITPLVTVEYFWNPEDGYPPEYTAEVANNKGFIKGKPKQFYLDAANARKLFRKLEKQRNGK